MHEIFKPYSLRGISTNKIRFSCSDDLFSSPTCRLKTEFRQNEVVVLNLGHSTFGFVSDFVLRYSDF